MKRKTKHRIRTARIIWRLIVASILFFAMVPVFYANKDNIAFYTIVIAISVIGYGLLELFGKVFRKKTLVGAYLESVANNLFLAMAFFGGSLLAARYISEQWQLGLLFLSCSFYALTLQRLTFMKFLGVL